MSFNQLGENHCHLCHLCLKSSEFGRIRPVASSWLHGITPEAMIGYADGEGTYGPVGELSRHTIGTEPSRGLSYDDCF